MKRIIKEKFKILKSNQIIIECNINNTKGKFILDTGASNSCLNYKLASKFKIICEKSNELASSATSQINETFISKKNILEIGEIIENNFTIILFDMTYINNSLKEQGIELIDGIIGGDILKKFNAKINYKKRQLSLKL